MGEPDTTEPLLARWREDLAAWAIPEAIRAGTTEDPWSVPRGLMVERARRQLHAPEGPSLRVAAEALQTPGTVLDIGAGAGAASLPLSGYATHLTAVDADKELLSQFGELAAERGTPVSCVLGQWPDVARQVPPADVVVCHNVFYNVADLAPFVAALTSHARRRVVVELTDRHPTSPLNPLWLRFHNLARPERPTAADAVSIVDSLGLSPRHQAWRRPALVTADPDEMVQSTRRRLCLPPQRSAEVEQAIRELSIEPAGAMRDVVTIWWDTQSEGGA
jgi:SAM-dependent methyltransferase